MFENRKARIAFDNCPNRVLRAENENAASFYCRKYETGIAFSGNLIGHLELSERREKIALAMGCLGCPYKHEQPFPTEPNLDISTIELNPPEDP